MKRTRIPFFLLLVVSLCLGLVPVRLNAQRSSIPANSGMGQILQFIADSKDGSAMRNPIGLTGPDKSTHSARSDHGGIKIDVADKYQERFEEWKAEFLSTETGRSQWDAFEHSEHFTLVITVSRDQHNGAGTSKYQWNDAGQLVSATITLGSRIDTGYPNPIYYPVMNALAYSEPSLLNGNILAAAKIAHEFGHVKQASIINGELYRLQNQLIPEYNKILLSNGRNTEDPRLVDLSGRMLGTPVEIWEDREYWGEANAMLYLRDRITKKSEQRALFSRIIKTVELYAVNYVKRFDEIAQ